MAVLRNSHNDLIKGSDIGDRAVRTKTIGIIGSNDLNGPVKVDGLSGLIGLMGFIGDP